jgi:orotate phosphoribosyltransferase
MDASEARPGPRTEALVELILARGYLRREEPFRLSSGGLSHDYVDMRRAVGRGADLALAADAVVAHLAAHGVDFDAIGGMTMGADPVAHAVALTTGAGWFSVRKQEKTHGSGRRIEGAEIAAGMRVVVFEDTVSTGGSILDATAVLRDAGADVVYACTLLDRSELAAPGFAALGIEYGCLVTYRDLGIEAIGLPESAAPAGA